MCRVSIYFDNKNIRDLIYKAYVILYEIELENKIQKWFIICGCGIMAVRWASDPDWTSNPVTRVRFPSSAPI